MYWIEFLSTYYFLPRLKEKILKEITKRKITNCVSPFIFSLHFTLSPQAFPSFPSHVSGSGGGSTPKCNRTICMWVLLSKKSMFYNLIFSFHIKPAILCITRVINAESDFDFLTLIHISTSNANNCDIRLYKNYQVHQLCLIKPFKSCFCYI